MKETYDVCIIGGGAAGLAAAIAASKKGCRVCIIDKNKKLGKKLYATGNGRCNLANEDMASVHYHSASKQVEMQSFLAACMGKNQNHTLFDFLHMIGVYEENMDGYFYPESMQASSVVWAFLDMMKSLSVTVKTSQTVREIIPDAEGYLVLSETSIYAKQVILACGGRAYPALGGCSLGSEIAQKMHIPSVKQRPALCGVVTKENMEQIKGVRVRCSAWIGENEGQKQYGELQITEYGLSGIMIFNLSSEIGKIMEQQKEVVVKLDFMSQMKKSLFISRANTTRSILGYLNAYLPDKLALYLIQKCGFDCKMPAEELSKEQLERLYYMCRAYEVSVTALKEYENAQVTAGGICLDAVNPKTMEIYQYPGLYATGEMLDIDGDCGGYNLTFAILTGLRAGESCHA